MNDLESFKENFVMFKAGIETMMPVGSLVKLSKLGKTKANILLRKEIGDLPTAQLDSEEPFTILELSFPYDENPATDEHYLFYDYRVYIRIIQHDIIGWLSWRWSAIRYDEALKLLAKSITVEL